MRGKVSSSFGPSRELPASAREISRILNRASISNLDWLARRRCWRCIFAPATRRRNDSRWWGALMSALKGRDRRFRSTPMDHTVERGTEVGRASRTCQSPDRFLIPRRYLRFWCYCCTSRPFNLDGLIRVQFLSIEPCIWSISLTANIEYRVCLEGTYRARRECQLDR